MKDKNITLTIQSPRGNWAEDFPKTSKVSEVIEAARLHFGFESGNFTISRDTNGEELLPERTLVSYGIEDCETLTLVPEQGSGVTRDRRS